MLKRADTAEGLAARNERSSAPTLRSPKRAHYARRNCSLRRSGKLNYRVRVFDASLHGCRVEFVDRPRIQEQLWVKFDGLQSIEAQVCWTEGFTTGVSFREPIHPAVFELLVANLK